MNGLNPRPITVKMIPPIYSHFQATTSKAIKTNDGMRWIRKAPSCCQMVNPGENASNANILIKSIARMQMTLGSQWITFKDGSIISQFTFYTCPILGIAPFMYQILYPRLIPANGKNLLFRLSNELSNHINQTISFLNMIHF